MTKLKLYYIFILSLIIIITLAIENLEVSYKFPIYNVYSEIDDNIHTDCFNITFVDDKIVTFNLNGEQLIIYMPLAIQFDNKILTTKGNLFMSWKQCLNNEKLIDDVNLN